MRRRTREPLMRFLRQRADFNIPIGTPTAPTAQLMAASLDVEEAGMYELCYNTVIFVNQGTVQNETNTQLWLDGNRVRGRGNWETLNNVVGGRFNMNYRVPVLLSEGGHYITIEAWSFNAVGAVINGSFTLDSQTLEVYKL